jgi:hypothetical protein
MPETPSPIESAPARGSKLQVQIYVNRQPGDLSEAVLAALPSLAKRTRKISWTVPLEHEGYAEPKDRDFLRAIGYEDFVNDLSSFWPARGPVWDALGLAIFPRDRPGVILAEGKSYPRELYGDGTKASPSSRARIAKAIHWTQEQLGLPPDPEPWLGDLYQTANRLADLCWLRDRRVEAWLVHLLFLEDHTHVAASQEEWNRALHVADAALGLDRVSIP